MNHIHFIIRKPAWYSESRELTLAFNLFMEVVHDIPSLNIILFESQLSPEQNISDEAANKISIVLQKIKQQAHNANDLIFFVKEPALLISKEVITRMINLLTQDNINCIVPSSYPNQYPTIANQHYFTLKGYQYYISEVLKSTADSIQAYDGQNVHFFAVKHSFLLDNHIRSNYFQIPTDFSNKTTIALGAYIHPFSDYFNGANVDMLEHIPSSAKNLLDIGCSSGEFGHAVINNLNLHVEGIEINKTAANIARQKLHKVYQGDALSMRTEQYFDCVSCLDVLEHFPDPDKLLQQIFYHYLSDDGVLILSLPNIGHWSIVDDLLRGHWDYLPGGTLCNTHLQFFTRRTILDLMNRNQYTTIKIIPAQAKLPDAIQEQFTLMEQSGKIIDWESLKTISFKVIACKKKTTDKQVADN